MWTTVEEWVLTAKSDQNHQPFGTGGTLNIKPVQLHKIQIISLIRAIIMLTTQELF